MNLNNRGYVKHVDDGDKFVVCDTNADGHGVQATLYRYSSGGGVAITTITDGGDSTCDYQTYNIKGQTKYYLEICWSIPGGECAKSGLFSES
ncbi:hypothetical protein ACIQM4_07030 [Streptomyces sp. NPDC091272]|uniref:hypothetical protein n=1 Tax=Streptomyces sp. NPDC091272 TaxID=3365981 RepID=UPI0038222EEE